MTKKLYVVTITYQAFVLAESESEALGLKDELLRWEEYTREEAVPYSGQTIDGWDDTCHVYDNGNCSVTLGEAKAMHAGGEEKG